MKIIETGINQWKSDSVLHMIIQKLPIPNKRTCRITLYKYLISFFISVQYPCDTVHEPQKSEAQQSLRHPWMTYEFEKLPYCLYSLDLRLDTVSPIILLELQINYKLSSFYSNINFPSREINQILDSQKWVPDDTQLAKGNWARESVFGKILNLFQKSRTSDLDPFVRVIVGWLRCRRGGGG